MWPKFDNAEEEFIEWNGIEPGDDEDDGDDSYSGLLSYPPGKPCSHSRPQRVEQHIVDIFHSTPGQILEHLAGHGHCEANSDYLFAFPLPLPACCPIRHIEDQVQQVTSPYTRIRPQLQMKADALVVSRRTAQQRDMEDQKDIVRNREPLLIFAVVPRNRTQ